MCVYERERGREREGGGAGRERERVWLSIIIICRQRFGNLVEVRGDKYATVIDGAPKDIFVLIHIYDEVRTAHVMPLWSIDKLWMGCCTKPVPTVDNEYFVVEIFYFLWKFFYLCYYNMYITSWLSILSYISFSWNKHTLCTLFCCHIQECFCLISFKLKVL